MANFFHILIVCFHHDGRSFDFPVRLLVTSTSSFIFLSIYLTASMPVDQLNCQSFNPYILFSLSVSLCVPVWYSVYLFVEFVYLSLCLLVRLFFYLYFCLPVYLYDCLSVSSQEFPERLPNVAGFIAASPVVIIIKPSRIDSASKVGTRLKNASRLFVANVHASLYGGDF